MVADLQPGDPIGPFVVDRTLGKGGNAIVVRVHDSDGQAWALKLLTSVEPDARERLLREGRIQMLLSHPCINRVVDVILVEGTPALVMDCVDGPHLGKWMHSRDAIDFDDVDDIAIGLLQALGYAHDQGVVHRDLKPSNVLLERVHERWVPRITDFGLAKAMVRADTSLTQTGVAIGTPCYMSPEQILDTKGAGPQSDLFSLGALLYELVSGERAFDGDSVTHIIARISAGSYARLDGRAVPPRMIRAIDAALHVDPRKRIGSCATMLLLWTAADQPTGPLDTLTVPDPPTKPFDTLPVRDAPTAPTVTLAVREASQARLDTRASTEQPRAGRRGVVAAVFAGVVVLGVALLAWTHQAATSRAPGLAVVDGLAPPRAGVAYEPAGVPGEPPPTPTPSRTRSPSGAAPRVPVRDASPTDEMPMAPGSPRAWVTAGAGVEHIWLVRDGRALPQGSLAPGTYGLRVLRAGAAATQDLGLLEFEGGRAYQIRCDEDGCSALRR